MIRTLENIVHDGVHESEWKIEIKFGKNKFLTVQAES